MADGISDPKIVARLEKLTKQAHTDRAGMLDFLLSYGETDLLYYRTPKQGTVLSPRNDELRKRQDAAFDPVLKKLHHAYGMQFSITENLVPVPQAAESLRTLKEQFVAAGDAELAALAVMTPLLGSALLAFSIWKRHVTVEDAIAMAHLDEDFQAEQWQPDTQEKASWETKQKDIRAAAFFLDIQWTEKQQ